MEYKIQRVLNLIHHMINYMKMKQNQDLKVMKKLKRLN